MTTTTTHHPVPTTTAGPTTETPEAPTPALRQSALTAGVALTALAVVAGAAYVGVVQRLVTTGDATATARDISASAGLFRLGIAAFALVVVLDVVVAWALRTFFEPVHKDLATLAAWLRLSYAAVFAVAISQLVGALHLLSDAPYLATLSIDQRHTEALLKIETFQDIWNVGYVLFGSHLVVLGYLASRSGYVPRFIGVLLVIAGAGYIIDSFGQLLAANYTLHVAAFSFVGEAVLMLWLLVKGRSVTTNT
jgi:hypothetical protein